LIGFWTGHRRNRFLGIEDIVAQISVKVQVQADEDGATRGFPATDPVSTIFKNC
jgi:hypothetical protein